MKTLVRLFVLLLLTGILYVAYCWLVPVTPPGATFVEFKPGFSTIRIAAELKRAGVVRSDIAFLIYHYTRGHKTLKAGEYLFDVPETLNEVYTRIARGDIYTRNLTIPEGFNIFDIARAVEAAKIGRQDQFLNLAKQQVSLISDLDPAARTLEGYLFPDTYRFTRRQTLQDVLAAMVKRFRHESQFLGLNSDFQRIVTMASLVEKETGVPEERPLIAGIFYNRLEQHMGLATDPSVIYAALLAGRYRGTIYQSDLQFNSPYNTYKYAGLPPGPVCNPGRASLKAAMHPEKTDYLYFVSDSQGHHRFARTLEEHSQNVATYRRAVGQVVR